MMPLIAVQSILAFAVTLASSFSLIYYLRNGFSVAVAITYLLGVFAVALALASTVHKWMVNTPRTAMSVGLGALVSFYCTLWLALSLWTIYLASILYGIYIALFWIPFNALTVRETSKENRCGTVGTVGFFWPIINVFAPLLGGMLIANVGYGAIFSIAMTTIAANIALILSVKSFGVPMDVSSKLTGDRYPASFRWAVISQGVYDGVLWTCTSVVTFFMLQQEIAVGAALSFFAIFGAAMSLGLGFVSDKKGKREYFIQLGVALAVPFLIASAISSNYVQYTIAVSLMNLGLPLIGTFLMGLAVDKMEHSRIDAIVLRERYLNTGRLIGGGMALVCALLGNLQLTFMCAAPFMLYIMFSSVDISKLASIDSFAGAFVKMRIRKL